MAGRPVPPNRSNDEVTSSPHTASEETERRVTELARAKGVDAAELVIGDAPPTQEPWRTPLDRATYPRRPPEVTVDYRQWLAATVADLTRHYEYAYARLSREESGDRELFLAAARMLAVVASATLRSDASVFGKLVPTGAQVEALAAVRVPTRLYATFDEHGVSWIDMPFWIGAGDVELTRARDAGALLDFIVPRLGMAVFFDDGTPAVTRRLAAHMAQQLVDASPLLALLHPGISPEAGERLGARFAKLLESRRFPKWSHTMPLEELERAKAQQDDALREAAPRFAREALIAAGMPPKEARAVLDFVRKRAERGGTGAGKRRA